MCQIRDSIFAQFIKDLDGHRNSDQLTDLYLMGLKLKDTFDPDRVQNFTGYVYYSNEQKEKGIRIREKEKNVLHLKRADSFKFPVLKDYPPVELPLSLTETQREVCDLLSRGYGTVKIATLMGCSVSNVSNIIRRARITLAAHYNRSPLWSPASRSKQKKRAAR